LFLRVERRVLEEDDIMYDRFIRGAALFVGLALSVSAYAAQIEHGAAPLHPVAPTAALHTMGVHPVAPIAPLHSMGAIQPRLGMTRLGTHSPGALGTSVRPTVTNPAPLTHGAIGATHPPKSSLSTATGIGGGAPSIAVEPGTKAGGEIAVPSMANCNDAYTALNPCNPQTCVCPAGQ